MWDDLAVFRAQTSAATATEDTSLLSVRLSCRQLQGAATAAVVRCAVLRHRAPRAPRALVKTLSVQEREFCLSKGITEGTYRVITPSTRKPLGSTILLYTYTHIHSLGSDTLVNVVALPVQCERLARTRISQISPFGSFRHWSKVGSGSRSKEFENLLSSV